MNICIKYCGGCNPRYDRKEIADKLKEDFEDININSQLDKKTCDFAVVILGCNRSCLNHDDIEGKYGKFIVSDSSYYQGLKEILTKLYTKKHN